MFTIDIFHRYLLSLFSFDMNCRCLLWTFTYRYFSTMFLNRSLSKAGYHRVGVHAEQAAPAHLSVGHGSTTKKTTPTHLTVDLLVKAKRIKMKLKWWQTQKQRENREEEGGINADAVKTTICWGLCAKASTCSVSPVNSFCKWMWFIRFWFISSSNLMCSLSLSYSLSSLLPILIVKEIALYILCFFYFSIWFVRHISLF